MVEAASAVRGCTWRCIGGPTRERQCADCALSQCEIHWPRMAKTLPKSIRFDPDQWDRIIARAKASKITATEAIRLLIEKGLREVE